jgi:superfamily II DNA or RNA helicase
VSIELYDYQKETVQSLGQKLITRSQHSAMLVSPTGSGKTYIALKLAELFQKSTSERPCLVICPANVVSAWESKARSFDLNLEVVSYSRVWRENNGYVKQGKGKKRRNVTLKLKPNTFIIFDEVQNCTGKGTWNSAVLTAARRQGYYHLTMTATPPENPLKFRALGYSLGLHNNTYDDYWAWTTKYGARPSYIHDGYEWEHDPEQMRALGDVILRSPNCGGVKVHWDTVKQAYGDNLTQVKYVDVTGLDKYYKNVIEELQDKALNALSVMNEQCYIRQEAEILKLKVLESLCNEGVENGYSVIIFVNFRESLYRLREMYPQAAVIHGEQNKSERKHNVKLFQDNTVPVCLCNIQAGGVGMDLHDPVDKKPRLSLISPPWSAVNFRQVLGRSYRAGGGDAVQQIIMGAGTIEEEVGLRLEQKLNCIDALTDDDFELS